MHDRRDIELLADFETTIWPLIRVAPYFRRSPKAVDFMALLFKQARKGESASIEAIAAVIFARGRFPKDKGLNALRTLAYRIRSGLHTFFETEPAGMKAGYTPEIRCVDGRYELTFRHKPQPDAPDRARDAFDRFWEVCPDPLILTSTRVFAAFGDRLFFRDISFEDGGDIKNFWSELGVTVPETMHAHRWRRTRHYVSAGETVGMLYIIDSFLSRGRKIQLGNLPKYGRSRGDANVIQIGLPRTSDTALHGLIQGERFYLTSKGVSDREEKRIGDIDEDKRQPLYPETEFQSDASHLDRSDARAARYVILTRRPNWDPNYSLTAITSNHGRATEAVCNFLCDDSRLEGLVGRLGSAHGETALRRFQVVFRVKLVRYGEREIEQEVEIVDPPSLRAIPGDRAVSTHDEIDPVGVS